MKAIPFFLSILILFSCASQSYIVKPIRSTLDLQGHRGARGLKPENTWPAFEEAIRYKMNTLELDTVLTKDGQVIIHHDSETNPVICQNEDGTKIAKTSLYQLTLADLKKLDCGSLANPKFPEQKPVPGTKLITVEEFFSKVAEYEKKEKLSLLFNIETKFPDDGSASDAKVEEHTTALLKAIEKAKVESRTTIQSFDLRTLAFVKKQKAKVRTSTLFAPSYWQGFQMAIGLGSSIRKEIIEKANNLSVDIISPFHMYVNPEFVYLAHERKLEVIPWTVNEKGKMKELISYGVDGIISDYPDRLYEVFQELK